jgi:F0F1-type ATP synthase membrane subunit b/b'
MTTFLLIVVLILGSALAIMYFLKRRVEKTVAVAQQQVVSAQQQRDAEVARARGDAEAAVANVQAAYEQKVTELDAEAERIRAQYEAEARKIADEANSRAAELEPLRGYAALKDAETEVQKILADAIAEATELRQEAKRLVDQTHEAATAERIRAQQRVKEIREQADALLTQATRDAGRIVADAEKRAEQIGGEAYTALRDKQLLEQAAAAMRNVIEGYGDRYIIPTHSVLDDLAVEFGYDAAGAALKSAREQSRRMVEQREAAACDYVEANRREIAIRFVIDAFNGRVDAILSRTKHDNYGTLEQEIRDAFSLVNLNGQAFRNARILPSYLDARLAELKWAVVVQELARKQREEQRYLKERLRDEEKARKEYEEKIRQAAKEEELKKRAVQEAEKRFASATNEQKAHYEQELQKLREELADATQRTLTIAQQTKKGHVYIISNVGSFGEGVYKIGQTRRPEPQDRVDELGGAGVPFEFDVHALLESENAPALEHRLHKQLLALQMNKINSRKEFFRVSLTEIHQEVEKLKQGEDFTVKVWSEKAIATEYRDSLDIENDPQKKENWIKRQKALSARQLQLDTLIFPVLPNFEVDEDNQEAGPINP